MIKQLFEELEKHSMKLAACESLTGGLFSASLTSVPGASKVFAGASVTYSNQAKIALGVKSETLDTHGAVSKETAKEMAVKVAMLYGTPVSVAFTGNAGPDVMEGKRAGEVYIAILLASEVTVYKLQLDGDRQKVREQCVNFAIKTILEKLRSIPTED